MSHLGADASVWHQQQQHQQQHFAKNLSLPTTTSQQQHMAIDECGQLEESGGRQAGAFDEQIHVRLSTFWYCFLALVTGLGLLVSLVSNMIIIYLFAKTPSLRRNPSNLIAVNLSLSDLLYCIQWPSVIYCSLTQSTWLLETDLLCQTFGFLTVSTAMASILTVLAMSIERALIIGYSIHAKSRFTIGGAWLVVAFIWLLAICCSLPPLFGKFNRYTLDPSRTSCTLDYLSGQTNYKLYILVLGIAYWVVPAILITICYVAIIITFKRSSRSLKSIDRPLAPADSVGQLKPSSSASAAWSSLSSPILRSFGSFSSSFSAEATGRRPISAGVQSDGRHRRTPSGWFRWANNALANPHCDLELALPKPPRRLPAARLAGNLVGWRPERGALQRGRSNSVAGATPTGATANQLEREPHDERLRPVAAGRVDAIPGATKIAPNDEEVCDAPGTHAQMGPEQQQRAALPLEFQSVTSAEGPAHLMAPGHGDDGSAKDQLDRPAAALDCKGATVSSERAAASRGRRQVGISRSQTLQELRVGRHLQAAPRCAGINLARAATMNHAMASRSRLGGQRPALITDVIAKRQEAPSTSRSSQSLACRPEPPARQKLASLSCHVGSSSSQLSRTSIQIRLAKMAFYLILLWFVSWTPIASLAMLNSVVKCQHRASALAIFLANTMTKLGPAFDVLIYGISHPKIKSKFRTIIKWLLMMGREPVPQMPARQSALEQSNRLSMRSNTSQPATFLN